MTQYTDKEIEKILKEELGDTLPSPFGEKGNVVLWEDHLGMNPIADSSSDKELERLIFNIENEGFYDFIKL